MSLPRISRRRRELAASRSSPLNRASPLVIVFMRGLRPMIVRQVTLLPDPDSPTMPSVLPFSTEKETPSTARTAPSSVLKCVLRSRTSRRLTRARASGRGRRTRGGRARPRGAGGGATRPPEARVEGGAHEVDERAGSARGAATIVVRRLSHAPQLIHTHLTPPATALVA